MAADSRLASASRANSRLLVATVKFSLQESHCPPGGCRGDFGHRPLVKSMLAAARMLIYAVINRLLSSRIHRRGINENISTRRFFRTFKQLHSVSRPQRPAPMHPHMRDRDGIAVQFGEDELQGAP